MKQFFKNIWEAPKRFPISTILLLAIFFTFIYIENFQSYGRPNYDFLLRLNYSFIITFFLSIGFYLTTESYKFNIIKTYLLQIVGIVFGISFYYFFGNNFTYENKIMFMITSFGIFSFLFFAPFTKEIFSKTSEQKEKLYFHYLQESTKVISIAFLIGGVTSFLGFIAINSINYLFSIGYSNVDTFIINWLIFCCSFFAPFYALSKVPKKSDLSENISQNPISNFFLKYIFFPFVGIFFIILYAYSVKVLINFQDWPKGQISWMVIFFSLFSYLAYLASYSSSEKSLVFLRKLIPFAVIPQVCMLFYSIYVRIANYGLTINRYLVVVFGIILFLVSIYLIFSKRKYLAVLPFILTFFSVFVSIGPWSIYNLPLQNQVNLLKNDLQKAGIISESGTINYDTERKLDTKISGNLRSKIDYICNYNKCSAIKELFSEAYEEFKIEDKKQWEENKKERIKRLQDAMKEFSETDLKRAEQNKGMLEILERETYELQENKWTMKNFIITKLGIDNYDNDYQRNFIRFNTEERDILQISGYDTFVNFYSYDREHTNIDTEENIISFGKGTEKEVVNLPFDLKERLESEITKNREEPIILEFQNKNNKYKLIITRAFFKKKDSKDNSKIQRTDTFEGILLIGTK